MFSRADLATVQRIVVKVGSSSLSFPNGRLNLRKIETIVRQLANLANEGRELILVSSGAVAAGMGKLNISSKPKELSQKQALAAVGQGLLMQLYEKLFSEYNHNVAQVLLTQENTRNYNQYIHSRTTLNNLLSMNVIPIINENDAVAVEEFIGDNDTLSARVAGLVDADLLIILSDIDGLYTANPHSDPSAQLISIVTSIDSHIEDIAGGAGSSMGTGGMSTKITAAKIATNSGIPMLIASSESSDILYRLIEGEDVGTLFTAKSAHLRQRKLWLAFGKKVHGRIEVDQGCKEALTKGSSLLASGIMAVQGSFTAGSTVQVFYNKTEIARGIVNYNSAELSQLQGHHSSEFASILHNKDNLEPEIIHRDNMVIMV